MTEPANLMEWKPQPDMKHRCGRLFTCGRPGRATFGNKRVQIGEPTISAWLNGLPKARPLSLISLLGKKKDHFSEFEYYPFRSVTETGSKPTFQEWLDKSCPGCFVVEEFPTIDALGIPAQALRAIVMRVSRLLEGGATVVVMDSAGAERTARVCESAGYERLSRTSADGHP